MDEQELNSNIDNPSEDNSDKQRPPEEEDAPKSKERKLTMEERKKIGGEVDRKYTGWREPRRTQELQWFLTAAYDRGKQSTETIQVLNTLQDITKMDRRKKNIANKLWAKGRARFAKFAKTRPSPVVIPFNTDRKSRLDARATEHALSYIYEKVDQEQKYLDVINWAGYTGKAYWWYNFNPKKKAILKQKDDITGTVTQSEFEGGDIEIEVDSAFSMLAPNLGKAHVKDQDEILRVRVMDVDDMKEKFEEFSEYIKADSHISSAFEFERQIAHLSGSEAGALASMSSDMKGPMTGVLLKEHYMKPSAKNPEGKYTAVLNGLAVKVVDELPFGFHDMENPYPCSEFADMPTVGQFYCPTFKEQLIPLQRGYNILRDRLESQIRMNVHPKWIVTRQARIPKGSLTNEAAEVVEWNFIPGMPEPHSVSPANVAADAWRFAQMLNKEFDDISSVQPAYEGKAGTTKSGVQAQALQEASDQVHSPDARGFELAIRDSAYKIRRMMKQFYDIPRLLSFSGRSEIPEVFEFSSDNIDEHAQIVVQIGSALSQFKSTKIQQLMELHKEGLLGDPNDPELKRRVLGMLDIGGIEQFQEEARQDEDMARMENIDMLDGKEIPVPMFYEDHMAHYSVHTDELKSPANKDLDENIKRSIIAHTILHMKFINPGAAYNLAMELGFQQLIQNGMLKPPLPSQPQMGPPGPGPQGPHPPGPPQIPGR